GGGGGAGRASGPGVVQGLFVVSPEQALAAFGHDFGGVAMRVADDGTLAAPAGEDVKHCYATKDQLKASNKVLETNRSQFRLSAEGGADVTVRSAKNKAVNLHKVVGTAPSRNERGDDLTGGPNCNQMGQAVMGKGKVKDKKEAVRQVKGTGMTLTEASSTGLDMMRYTNELAGGSSRKSAEKTVTRHNARRESTPQVEKKEPTRAFRMPYAADVQNVKTRVGDVLMRWAGENRNTGIYKLEGDHATATVRDDAAGAFADQIRHIEDDMKRDRPRCLASIDDVGAGAPTFFGEYDTTAQEDEDRDAIDTYDNLDPVAKEKAQKKAGLDVYAAPEVGEAFSIAAVAYPGRDEDVPFPYHWAGVVAKAGADTVTLENYAGRDASGVYFTMYGPQTKVTVGDGSVTKADDQGTKEDKESTTFHGQWKETFPGVHTVTHAAKMVEKK
ncbi:MAG: hypothetical protein KC635_13430, partial [Myxococcales bacterium]|nr:hypothetical protein [Myxococcales bacterium]